jgi:hypothetical protein
MRTGCPLVRIRFPNLVDGWVMPDELVCLGHAAAACVPGPPVREDKFVRGNTIWVVSDGLALSPSLTEGVFRTTKLSIPVCLSWPRGQKCPRP